MTRNVVLPHSTLKYLIESFFIVKIDFVYLWVNKSTSVGVRALRRICPIVIIFVRCKSERSLAHATNLCEGHVLVRFLPFLY